MPHCALTGAGGHASPCPAADWAFPNYHQGLSCLPGKQAQIYCYPAAVQAAVLAALSALKEAWWIVELPRMAAELAGAREQPAAASLAVVRALPTSSPRSALLQQHAAAALAARLLLVRLRSPGFS